MKRIFPWLTAVLLGVGSADAEVRTWTNSAGKTLQAEFVGLRGDLVALKSAGITSLTGSSPVIGTSSLSMTCEVLDGVKNMGENLHSDISRTLSGLIPPDSCPLVVVLLSRGPMMNHGYLVFTLYAKTRSGTH